MEMVNHYCPCSKNFIKKLFSKKYHLPYINFMENLNVLPKIHREVTKKLNLRFHISKMGTNTCCVCRGTIACKVDENIGDLDQKLQLISCMTQDKFLKLSVPHFSHL